MYCSSTFVTPQFKQSSNAPLIHRQAGDGRRNSKLCWYRQTVPDDSSRYCKFSGTNELLVRCTDSFMHVVGRAQMTSTGNCIEIGRSRQSSAKYDRARPWRHLKTIMASLNCIRCRMESQWRLCSSLPVWCGQTFWCRSQQALRNSVLTGSDGSRLQQGAL